MGGPFSSTQSAASAGAGVDLALRKWFAIRILEVDYVTNISGSPHTNNVGASAGIVFRFGGTAQARQRGVTSVQRETPPVANTGQGGITSVQRETPPVANTGEAPLLGVVGYATDEGLKVTSVRPGSPAEKIFLKPGDVISKIDDKEVKNGRDIESAVAASTSGTIKVTGLDKAEIGGYGDMIQFERKIKVR
jgi:S1-C subfamily serine protease